MENERGEEDNGGRRRIRPSKFAPLPSLPSGVSRPLQPRLAHPGGPLTTNKAAALAKFLERKLQEPNGLSSLNPDLIELAVKNAKETVQATNGSSSAGRMIHVASFGESEVLFPDINIQNIDSFVIRSHGQEVTESFQDSKPKKLKKKKKNKKAKKNKRQKITYDRERMSRYFNSLLGDWRSIVIVEPIAVLDPDLMIGFNRLIVPVYLPIFRALLTEFEDFGVSAHLVRGCTPVPFTSHDC